MFTNEKVHILSRWQWPANVDLDAKHEKAVDVAVEAFNHPKRQEFVVGLWILSYAGHAFMIQTAFDDRDEKNVVFETMPELLHMIGADSYSIITETWVAKVPLEDKDILPSEHPDHEDALQIITQAKDGGCRMTQFVAKYPKPHETWKVPRLLERDNQDATGMEGRLINLFNKEQGDA